MQHTFGTKGIYSCARKNSKIPQNSCITVRSGYTLAPQFGRINNEQTRFNLPMTPEEKKLFSNQKILFFQYFHAIQNYPTPILAQ